jgi:ethanolamine transporter EutH
MSGKKTYRLFLSQLISCFKTKVAENNVANIGKKFSINQWIEKTKLWLQKSIVLGLLTGAVIVYTEPVYAANINVENGRIYYQSN